MSNVERWKRIRHPAIITLRDALLLDGTELADMQLWFVYDYHPGERLRWVSALLLLVYMVCVKEKE
jgi:hypothetical protein